MVLRNIQEVECVRLVNRLDVRTQKEVGGWDKPQIAGLRVQWVV